MSKRVKISSFPIKLDIGCGKYKKEGYIGLDNLDFGQEIIWDIACGLPLPDDSVESVYCSHFVEHLTEPLINMLFWELQRVCISGTKMIFRCPADTKTTAYDIAHFSRWNLDRFRGIADSMGNSLLEAKLDEHGDIFVEIRVEK